MQEQKVFWKKIKPDVQYRIRNGYIEIDLGRIVESIASIEEFKYKSFDNLKFFLTKDENGKVLNSTAGVIINKLKQYFKTGDHLPQTNVQVQQREDWNTTSPDNWSKLTFLRYIAHVFHKIYGIENLEINFNQTDPSAAYGRAKAYGHISAITSQFKARKLTAHDVKAYIDWTFREKGRAVTVSMGFLGSKVVMQDWMIKNHKGVKTNVQLDYKWHK